MGCVSGHATVPREGPAGVPRAGPGRSVGALRWPAPIQRFGERVQLSWRASCTWPAAWPAGPPAPCLWRGSERAGREGAAGEGPVRAGQCRQCSSAAGAGAGQQGQGGPHRRSAVGALSRSQEQARQDRNSARKSKKQALTLAEQVVRERRVVLLRAGGALGNNLGLQGGTGAAGGSSSR